MKAKTIINLLILFVLGVLPADASRIRRVIEPVETIDEIESHLLMAMEEAPVHRDILTTVFWVGERAKPNSGWSSNLDSAWDHRWKENFGGLDSPIYRKGYFPAKFRPRQNPFYVALPFNDISNPSYLESCPLLQYFRVKKASKVPSVCKNRWIEISHGKHVCYAQWQDVGPVYTDDYDYVFRGEKPRAHGVAMAGLDVSPAVRDFLRFNGTCRSDWRFVEERDVPEGPWKKVVTRS